VAHVKPNGWGDVFTPRMAADLRVMLGSGLTFRDNMNAAIITFDAQHGEQTLVANPLSTKPLAFFPSESFSITAIGGVSNQEARPIDGDPVLNTSRTDGMLGITVRFAAPDGVCVGYRSAALSLATDSTVGFDTVESESGDLSLNTTTGVMTCAKAGFVHYSFTLFYNGDAAGTFRGGYIILGGSTTQYGMTRQMTNGTTVQVSACGSAVIPVAADGTIRTRTNHDAGGATGLTVTTNRTRFSAHYVAPPAGCLGRVTGILVGG
jgi:hypothetical protein